MTKLTRKLFISILTVAFAVITLGTTTFAWFTLSSTAEIESFNAEVTAGDGIEISLNGSVFKRTISNSEILTRIKSSFVKFDTVTSSNGKSMEYLNSESASAQDYVEFQLWFRTPSAGKNIYLVPPTSISSDIKTWKADTAFNYAGYGSLTNVVAGTPINIYAANMLRMSFEEYTSINFTEKTATSTATEAKVFELDPAHIDRGETTPNTENLLLGIGPVSTPGLVDYWQKKLGENLLTTDGKELDGEGSNKRTISLPTTVYGNTDIKLGGQSIAAPTFLNGDTDENDGYYYSYVMVRMWIEGWDPDCFDAALKTSINVKLNFEIGA